MFFSPDWQLISQEQHELRGLGFVKGLTYFVAIVDSLAGIVAAILTNMFRRPRSFWKSWAESVKVPQKCESVHYEGQPQNPPLCCEKKKKFLKRNDVVPPPTPTTITFSFLSCNDFNPDFGPNLRITLLAKRNF